MGVILLEMASPNAAASSSSVAELGERSRQSGLPTWDHTQWSEENRIVQDVPITVGTPGTDSYRVIHSVPLEKENGLPSSMLTGRGRIALSSRESSHHSTARKRAPK